MFYTVILYWGHGNTEYYAVVADTQKQAQEKLELAFQKEGDSLKLCHSIDIDEVKDVSYITETSN